MIYFIVGYVTPPTTGVLGIQSVKTNTVGIVLAVSSSLYENLWFFMLFQSDFRTAAMGVVLGMAKTTNIVKKLKLTGSPYKIFINAVFIQGMFNSALPGVFKIQRSSS